jgi:acetyl-CoA synthetase
MIERLDRYHFYEREFEDYDELRDWFEWEIPEHFSIPTATCERWAEEDPEATAVIAVDDQGSETRYTYRELDRRASKLADALRTRGVDRGDRVGINAPQRVETLVSYLATWKLGGVVVPLSVRFEEDALAYRLGDCGVTVAVVDRERIDAFAAAVATNDVDDISSILVVDGDEDAGDRFEYETDGFDDALREGSSDVTAVETRADEDAMVIYTSGTTGDPKGVRHVQSFLLGHLPTAVTGFLNVDPDDRELFNTPVEWAWVGPIWAFVLPALFYGKSVIAHHGRFDPERTFEIVDKYGVTRMLGPTTVWRRLRNVENPAERYETGSVEVIMSAGESMGEEAVEWVTDIFNGAAVHEGYGQTEAMNLVMDCSVLFPQRPEKMGKATPGVEVRILDPESAEPTVPTGEVGEIAVRYDDSHLLCFEEYWNMPEKTAEKVVDGWLFTEDLGFVDEDGYYEFVGRKDDVIICSGYRIGPEEVEESLAGHEAVAAVGVIGVPDEDLGEVPKAFIVLREGYEPSADLTDWLKAHVKESLAAYEYPRIIEYIEDLPTTGSGKVARSELRERE